MARNWPLSMVVIATTTIVAQSHFANPVNITMYGLRPKNITGLDNKDTGNPSGDLLFFFMAKLMVWFFTILFLLFVTANHWSIQKLKHSVQRTQ